MKLREVIDNLEQFDDDLVVFVSTESVWNPDSEAVLIPSPNLAERTGQLPRFSYFLEVEIAKDVLDVWRKWRNNREPTGEERLEAVLFYAENDTYLG
jgi:hypothetical protein